MFFEKTGTHTHWFLHQERIALLHVGGKRGPAKVFYLNWAVGAKLTGQLRNCYLISCHHFHTHVQIHQNVACDWFASQLSLLDKLCFSSSLVRIVVRKAAVKQTVAVAGQYLTLHFKAQWSRHIHTLSPFTGCVSLYSHLTLCCLEAFFLFLVQTAC